MFLFNLFPPQNIIPLKDQVREPTVALFRQETLLFVTLYRRINVKEILDNLVSPSLTE